MMARILNRSSSAIALAGLALASCGGPKALSLPTDPVDRAATCGIVAAAEARNAAADVSQPLPLAARGRILHYALLAGSADGRFSAETAGAVSRRMSALQADVTNGKWQDLAPACRAAFPAAAAGEATLPAGRLDAQLGCSELAQFTATALEADKGHYAAQLSEYRGLRTKLSDRIGPALRSRAGSDLSAQRAAGDKALAAIAQHGSPVAVLDQCLKQFG
ncbi:MAG: hypothetical protein JWO81_1554 [Alphaproteobacteria bacterium]|nr:hypothetical protein [Alphaproteobacteria bacterium]